MTSCILQDIINDININTMLYYCVPLESVLDNGYCFKPFLYLIFILYCISFADIISIWEILRADVILFSIAHTNLKSMTMPYLGRVPSPGWKRACNFISHPGMWKVEGGGGYTGLFPMKLPHAETFFMNCISHRFSLVYQGHTITTKFHSSAEWAWMSRCVHFRCVVYFSRLVVCSS